jgi:hypothetical protein
VSESNWKEIKIISLHFTCTIELTFIVSIGGKGGGWSGREDAKKLWVGGGGGQGGYGQVKDKLGW